MVILRKKKRTGEADDSGILGTFLVVIARGLIADSN